MVERRGAADRRSTKDTVVGRGMQVDAASLDVIVISPWCNLCCAREMWSRMRRSKVDPDLRLPWVYRHDQRVGGFKGSLTSAGARVGLVFVFCETEVLLHTGHRIAFRGGAFRALTAGPAAQGLHL